MSLHLAALCRWLARHLEHWAAWLDPVPVLPLIAVRPVVLMTPPTTTAPYVSWAVDRRVSSEHGHSELMHD